MMTPDLDAIVGRAYAPLAEDPTAAPRLIARTDARELVIVVEPHSVDGGSSRAGLTERALRFVRRQAGRVKRRLTSAPAVPREPKLIAWDALAHVIRSLEQARAVIMTPEVHGGAAGRVPLLLANALHALPLVPGEVVLVSTGPRDRSNSYVIPPAISHVVFSDEFQTLDQRWREWVVAQAIEISGAELVIAIDDELAEHAFAHYPRPNAQSPERVGFFSHRGVAAGEGEADRARGFGRVFVDTPAVAERVRELADGQVAVDVLAPFSASDIDTVVRYGPAYLERHYGDGYPFRILAVAGTEAELGEIARLGVELETLPVPTEIHLRVHGEAESLLALGSMPTGFAASTETLPLFLADLPIEDFHTVMTFGADLVDDAALLQAQLLGIPVVAADQPALRAHPAVQRFAFGDVSEAVEQIRLLAENLPVRQSIIDHAARAARESIQAQSVAATVRREFGPVFQVN